MINGDVVLWLRQRITTGGCLMTEEQMTELADYVEKLRDLKSEVFIGMDVSIDVSTNDDDSNNRYFGKVTDVVEFNNSKHGMVLLIQEPEKNF